METNRLIATRIKGKGDTWELIDDKTSIEYPSLTDALEAYVLLTKFKGEYRLNPLGGTLQAIVEVEEKPQPKKKFNLYGDH